VLRRHARLRIAFVSIRPVRLYGDPVLRTKAAEVTRFDESLRSLASDMRDTMSAYNGIGLAANQIGVLERVLVVDVPLDDETRARYTMVNPSIVKRAGSESGEEGCLSIPGIYEDVTRALKLTVQAVDEQGKAFEVEAEGYLARAIQHEVDHLDGVLFIDRLSPLRRQFLRRPLESLARGEMPDGYQPPAASGGAS
jgi:peptide deformylase